MSLELARRGSGARHPPFVHCEFTLSSHFPLRAAQRSVHVPFMVFLPMELPRMYALYVSILSFASPPPQPPRFQARLSLSKPRENPPQWLLANTTSDLHRRAAYRSATKTGTRKAAEKRAPERRLEITLRLLYLLRGRRVHASESTARFRLVRSTIRTRDQVSWSRPWESAASPAKRRKSWKEY